MLYIKIYLNSYIILFFRLILIISCEFLLTRFFRAHSVSYVPIIYFSYMPQCICYSFFKVCKYCRRVYHQTYHESWIMSMKPLKFIIFWKFYDCSLIFLERNFSHSRKKTSAPTHFHWQNLTLQRTINPKTCPFEMQSICQMKAASYFEAGPKKIPNAQLLEMHFPSGRGLNQPMCSQAIFRTSITSWTLTPLCSS